MDRAQGIGTKQGAPPARPELTAALLLADVEAALARAYPAAAVKALIAPLREAAGAPPDKRDPEKLDAAFELVEDVLEAAGRAG